jgi:uncharacterized membrane protein
METLNSIYHTLPQPDDISIREKEDAMGAYFMMFATHAIGLPLPFISLVAAVIYLYLNKKTSRFVHFHSLQALYAHIPVAFLNAGLIAWLIVILIKDAVFTGEFKGYLIMTGVANIVYLIFSLIAAFKARKGLFYYFILFGKLAYHRAYIIREEQPATLVNKPPVM